MLSNRVNLDSNSKFASLSISTHHSASNLFITSSFLFNITFWFITAIHINFSEAGLCWSSMNANGRCSSVLKSRVSKEDCCSDGKASTAYSVDDLESGELFFYRAFQGGVPCQQCKNTCEGVNCGPGKRCLLRNENKPVCVCNTICTSKMRKMGKVCGTDGRTYRHQCRLLKRKCRRDTTLSIAYYGSCQKKCENIRCQGKQTCVLDQNLTPHCVKCAEKCPVMNTTSDLSRLVCGADNQTYASPCHLRQAACLRGKAIQIAYRGRCKPNADCANIKCPRGRKCLIDTRNGNQPRCVTCPMPCIPFLTAKSPQICASNNRTYDNWCSMMQDACSTGIVLQSQSSELCQKGDLSIANMCLECEMRGENGCLTKHSTNTRVNVNKYECSQCDT